MIAYECADDFSCGYLIIDRSTGERSPIDLDTLARTAPRPVGELTFMNTTPRILPPGWFGGNPTATVVDRFAVIGVEHLSEDGQAGYYSQLVVNLDRVAVTAHITSGYSTES